MMPSGTRGNTSDNGAALCCFCLGFFVCIFQVFYIFVCVCECTFVLFYFDLVFGFLFIVCVVVFFSDGLFKNIDYRSERADTYKILDGNGAI